MARVRFQNGYIGTVPEAVAQKMVKKGRAELVKEPKAEEPKPEPKVDNKPKQAKPTKAKDSDDA